MSVLGTPIQIIGSSGGQTPINFGTGHEGFVLRKIGVWVGEWQLKGIRVWFTSNNGSSQTYGTPNSGPYKEFEFRDGERFRSLSLWGNGAGTRSGGIRFRTTLDREFFHHMTKWGLKQEYVIDVFSGLCVGIRGRCGWDIDSLGFAFLLPVAAARMINVQYPTLALDTAGIQPITLEQYQDENGSYNSSNEWSNSGSHKITKSSSWSLTAGLEAHFTVSVSAGIPMIGEASTEAGWKISVSGTHSTSTEETTTRDWARSGTLGPREWMKFLVSTRHGVITVPYKATMEIRLSNGTTFTYPLEGLYSGVTYTSLHFQIQKGSLDAATANLFDQMRSLQDQLGVTHDHTNISTAITTSTTKLSTTTTTNGDDVEHAKTTTNNTVNELHVVSE